MDTTLLLALLFGAPVLALALAVGYHARLYLLDRRGNLAAAPVADPEMVDSGPPSEVVHDLRRSIDELHDQLSRQGDALSNLLSESARRMAQREIERSRPARPKPAEALAAPPDPVFAGADLSGAVAQLTAEGLSDRAIARRLRIGLEEVRLLGRRRAAPTS